MKKDCVEKSVTVEDARRLLGAGKKYRTVDRIITLLQILYFRPTGDGPLFYRGEPLLGNSNSFVHEIYKFCEIEVKGESVITRRDVKQIIEFYKIFLSVRSGLVDKLVYPGEVIFLMEEIRRIAKNVLLAYKRLGGTLISWVIFLCFLYPGVAELIRWIVAQSNP